MPLSRYYFCFTKSLKQCLSKYTIYPFNNWTGWVLRMKSPDIDISGIGTVVQKRIKVQDENESHRELYTQHRVE